MLTLRPQVFQFKKKKKKKHVLEMFLNMFIFWEHSKVYVKAAVF